jgi:hypothetical protein
MRLIPSLAGMLLVATAAMAQPAPDAAPPEGMGMQGMQGMQGGHAHMPLAQRFEAANTTHDGKLTREQAEAGGMKRIADHFDDIDTGKKGYVTIDDIKAWAQTQHHGHMAPQ